MAEWNVVGTAVDTPAPSKWNVQSVVKEPAEGDAHLGGDTPEGFHAVTGDDGQQTLRKNIGAGDIMQMAGNLPGVGLAQELGASAVNLGKKAMSGIAGMFGADTDAMAAIRKPVELPESHDPILGALGAVNEGAQKLAAPIDAAVENLPDGARTVVQGLEEAIPDVAALAGARVPLKGVGPTVGEVASAPKNLVKDIGAAHRAASGAGEEWEKAGLRTGGGHAIARQVAGDSGQEALVGHNAQVGNTIAASEAGHGTNVPMTYESLAEAREAPNTVYNRIAHGLPEGKLDEVTTRAINNAGAPEGGRMSAGSPQAQQAIASLKAQLLDPNRSFTGQQMVNELRGLRQEGFTNSASDDVSNQQLGKAQLSMARALEDHIGRNIPKGGDVSLEQFQTARKALAKNWTVQAALRGGDVDLKAIGRVYRNDPELLDGGLKVLGEFAEGPGKDVVGIPDRYNPPSALKDITGIVNVHRPVQSTLQGVPGVGSSARRFLTGNTDEAIQKATKMFPGRRPGAFDPQPGLTPPPGRVGRPNEPPTQLGLGDLLQSDRPLPPHGMLLADDPATAAQAPMGDFAKVLSEGVPPSRPPGLSVGSMGIPQGEGLPFRNSPEMLGARPVQGGSPQLRSAVDDYGNQLDLERSNSPGAEWEATQPPGRKALGDRFALPAQEERLGDVGAVGHQGRVQATRVGNSSLGYLLNDLNGMVGPGVPEDIAARTAPGRKLTNNASGESSASVEAINRDKLERAEGKERYLIDPDGKMWPVRGVEAADAVAPKGSIIVQKGVGKERFSILDRGGLPQSHANGLLNRALAGGEGLTLGDLVGG